MNSFKRFNEEKLCARKYFFSSTKKGKIDEDGKISDGHISIEDYLTCEKIWNKFKMKNMSDYHYHYLKKYVLFFYCLTFVSSTKALLIFSRIDLPI